MARSALLAALVIASACAESRPQAPTQSISVETSCLGSQSGGISNHCYPGNTPLGDAGAMIAKDASAPTGGSVATTVQADAGVACAPTACPIDQAWNAASCRCEGHCDPYAELAARLGSSKPVDCGTLPVNAPAADVTAARRCVLDALTAKRAFKLIEWTFDQRNSREANFFAYAGGDSFVSALSYIHWMPVSGPGNGQADVYEARCRGLIETRGECTDSQVCLTCKELIEDSVVCRAAPSLIAGCLSPGIYSRGKGMNPGECCAPLREITRRAPYMVDGKTGVTCAGPTGYALFACVEGTCGDGRCEDAENVDCGCSLDCHDIVGPDADAGLE